MSIKLKTNHQIEKLSNGKTRKDVSKVIAKALKILTPALNKLSKHDKI